ncbi:ribose-phosphate diphosphokinase, partial [Candidatus Woesearchaeota archaeon]|nr:ribose-phosphate diphosphokinase [Candidatus Woesearchaeota archaeon]
VPSIPPREQRQSELEEFLEAANKDSRRITIVYPTLDKSRQDRRNKPGEANDIVMMARKWEALGADRLMTVDLHNEISAGIFEARDIAVDNLSAAPIFAYYIVENFNISEISIASADATGAARARRLRNLVYKAARSKIPQLDSEFHIPIAIIDKERTGHHKSRAAHVIGDVEGRIVLVFDDIVDTSGTLEEGSEAFYKAGAREVYAMATHPILSGPAVERIKNSGIKGIITSNLILEDKKIKELDDIYIKISLGPLLAEAIKRTHFDLSMRSLYEYDEVIKIYEAIRDGAKTSAKVHTYIANMMPQKQK